MSEIEKPDGQLILAGPPGAGKTSLAREFVQSHVRKKAGVFVMDCNSQFADILPWYESVSHYHWAQVKRQEEGKQVELSAAIGSAESEELTDYVVSLCKKREDPECTWKVPYFVLVYDEVTLIRGMGPSYVPPSMEILLGNRRHIGVILCILCQEMTQLHPRWQGLATGIAVFKTKSRERQRVIAKRFGIEPEHLEANLLPVADRHEFLLIAQERFVPAAEGIG